MQSSNSLLELEALALKLYIEASADEDWFSMLICWAVVLRLEEHGYANADG